MIDILLCHSETTTDVALQIATRLQAGAEAKVWLEEISASFTLFDAWDGALTSAGILIILSPDAMPSKLDRQQWDPILTHIAQNRQPAVASLLIADCPYPRLLERKNFFRWQSNSLDVLRAIERWAIGLHRGARTPLGVAPLPRFGSRARELEWLYSHVVDRGGTIVTLSGNAAAGKTALAQEFVREAAGQFREVLWISCGELSDVFILGDVISQLGILTKDAIAESLRDHRLLLVFDDVRRRIPISVPDQSRCSVLMTTRDAAVASGAILDLAALSKISAESPADETLRLLWHSMSVCLPCGFLEDLPTRMTGIEREVAGRAIQRLVGSGLVDRFDQERLRLNDVSRSAALKDSDTLALRRCHARILHETFTSDSLSREGLVPEALAAIDYACRKDWQLAQELGLRVSDCLRERMRNEEAAETLRSILVEARRRNDKSAIQKFEWEISWLQDGDQVRAPIVAPQQLQLSFTS